MARKQSHGGDARPLLVRMLEDNPEQLAEIETRGNDPRGGPLGGSLTGPAKAMQAAWRDLQRQPAAARLRARRAGLKTEVW